MQRLFAAVLTIVALLCGPGASRAEDAAPVTLPGGIWAIAPPPGFSAIREPTAAFRHPSGAIILVQDMRKGPIQRSYFDIPPAHQSEVRVEEVTDVTVNGRRGILSVVYTRARRTLSIIALVEGETSNGLITALLPDNAGISLKSLRASVLSAIERPMAMEDRLKALPFTMVDMAGMRVAYYASGTSVVLTDGPLDNKNQAPEQTFAQIYSIGISPGENFGKNELAGITAQFMRMFPGARLLTNAVIDTPQGDTFEVVYERETTTGKPVAGVTWMRVIGSRAVTMICQHPRNDKAALAKLVRIRDGLGAKGG
ncbi:hypothetical protein LHFGNBLO_005195 [Mesorhizobium sp. AR10]|uniref:hypothetical protein n=1 Tax=Mesorhizobium sp. AR10 TaxID=2865839 RepID=UPI00215EF573|nr:hypothetical protein [Mesorhizobium sp. AR10]UVK38068.1 hypothetical protein LHFGNBLO_005195 [Mesorhizobium sp. AR10]